MPTRSIVAAPSNLGLRPPAPGVEPGCRHFAEALLATGFADAIGVHEVVTMDAPPYAWPPTDGRHTVNAPAIADYSRTLAEATGRILDAGSFPIVIGGDCSIAIGPALALRRRGRFGLAFVDGHSDFRSLANSPAVGAAAGEELALMTGRGDPVLTDLDGLGPLYRDEDVIAVGDTDVESESPDPYTTGITVFRWAPELLGAGIERAIAGADAVLRKPGLDGYWVHLDVDVLDSRLMPAVDSPHDGGLDWPTLHRLLLALLPGATGIDITIFDPTLDPHGHHLATLSTFLTDVFRERDA